MNHRFHSILNFSSLIAGLTVFIFILLYIVDEQNYDKYHDDYDRIYRIVNVYDKDGVGEHASSSPFPLAEALRIEYPNMVESTVRFFNFQKPSIFVSYRNKKYNEERFFFVDSTLFDIYKIKLLSGDIENIKESGYVFITKTIAEKYFDEINPIGEEILIEGGLPLKIGGVIEDTPSQSHFKYDFLASFLSLKRMMGQIPHKNWIWNPCWTYVKLKEGVRKQQIEKELPNLINKYYNERAKFITMYLQKIQDIHLHSHIDYEIEQNNNYQYINMLKASAFFVLIITLINFINLSSAASLTRAKEVGIKKVFGSQNNKIILQFIAENLIISFTAFLSAMFIVELSLPIFNDILDKDIVFNYIFTNYIFLFLVGLAFLNGLLAAIYPAFYLSSLDTIKVLHKRFSKIYRASKPRQVLVVMQYTISIIIIIATIVNISQFVYMKTADLGFNKKNIIILPVSNNPMLLQYEKFKEELLRYPEIKNITAMFDMLGVSHNTRDFYSDEFPKEFKQNCPDMIVDFDFIETFEMEIIAGRNFDKFLDNNYREGVILNEAITKHLGCETPDEAIGKSFSTPFRQQKVIGVVKDFNVSSLHTKISPFVIHFDRKDIVVDWAKYLAIKVSDDHVDKALKIIEYTWDKYSKERPFEYSMLEDELMKLYKYENILVRLSIILSLISLLITGLGIMGLTSYITQQRTKEIGLRKALGAEPLSILKMLNMEFFKLLIISNIVSWIIGYFIQKQWLDNFVYSVQLQLWMFLLAGLIAFLFTAFMVSFQTINAANTNPVDSLRYE